MRSCGRILQSLALLGAIWLSVESVRSQAPPPPSLVVLTAEGRRPLPTSIAAGRQMVSLADLATVVPFTVREDVAAGGLSIVVEGTTIVLSLSQGLASVGTRVVSLPAAPVRSGTSWLVPIDFIGRVLALASKTPLDHHTASGLIVVGPLNVPRVVVRYDATRSVPTLTFGITPRATQTISQEPGRLVVQFDVTTLDADIVVPPGNDVFRGASLAEGGRAIIVELGPRFGSYRAQDAPVGAAAQRLTLELVPSESQTTSASPATAPGAAPSVPLPGVIPPEGTAGGASASAGAPIDLSELTASRPALRTIVIDPGHGGDEPGAKGPIGTLEKDVTLAVARRLEAMIENRLGLRVLMTRETDIGVPLEQRASVANNNKADLFVSIHANASVRPNASGAEVFYLSLGEYGQEARRATDAERQFLPLFNGGARDVELIQWEMAQARHITDSSYLAQMVEDELRKRVPMSGRALQQAPFRVLVGANMPAVLVEMGFLTNVEEEQQLARPERQTEIAQAIFESIVRFRSYREDATPPLVQ